MTLVIELSAVEEAQLTAAARQMGSTPEMLAKQLVTQHLPHDIQAADAREAVRAAAIQKARGSMAHFDVSTEDLHRERQSDKDQEEAYLMEAAQ